MDKKKFVDKAKGLPIRLKDWPEGMHFIPNGDYWDITFDGILYLDGEEIEENKYCSYCLIRNGFEPDEKGHYWEIDKRILLKHFIKALGSLFFDFLTVITILACFANIFI